MLHHFIPISGLLWPRRGARRGAEPARLLGDLWRLRPAALRRPRPRSPQEGKGVRHGAAHRNFR